MGEFKDSRDLIKSILRQYKLNFKFDVFRLKTSWPDIVGENLSTYTTPARIYKKTLFVNCIHQGLIQTLQFHKNSIKEKIQKMYPDKVEDIKFIYGKIS